jgi:hypothetical protein
MNQMLVDTLLDILARLEQEPRVGTTRAPNTLHSVTDQPATGCTTAGA